MATTLRTPADVGAAIRARRRSLGWDQSELAERMGASRLWVSQVEAGKPGAGLGLVLRAFGAMGLTLSAGGPSVVGAEVSTPARAVDLNAILEAARKKPAP